MNVKKLLALLLAATIITTALAGCAAKSYSGNSSAIGIAPADGSYSSEDILSSSELDRKLVRRISMDLQTQDLESLLETIREKVAQLDGYVQNSNVNMINDDSRCATLTLRIPADSADTFTDHVASVSNVIFSSQTAEDITLNYVSTESRQKALLAEETRLLALIDKAANLTELLQLEKRLSEVRTELERVTSQLKVYDDLVDYATVELSIDEVREYTPQEEPGFWQRLGTGFVNSLRGAGKIALEVIIILVCAIPYLLPPAVIASIVLLIIKQIQKRKNRKAKK